MPPTRAQQAEKTRAAILETARRLFGEHGYDATSLQQIADAMGVRKANVYYYFRTKMALLDALLEPLVDGLRVVVEAAEQIPEPAGRRAFLIDGFVTQAVASYRTTGSLGLGDPGLRRHVESSRVLDAVAERGLHAVYGPGPSPDQVAAYWMLIDLAPALRRSDRLPDDELHAVLTRLCLRMLDV